MEASGDWYTTASGEKIEDAGGRKTKGCDCNGNNKMIEGRSADVHKILVSGVKVCKLSDVWLGHDGGYIIPQHTQIYKEMRKQFDKLVKQYGTQELTPIYEKKGTFVFDYYLEKDPKGIGALGKDKDKDKDKDKEKETDKPVAPFQRQPTKV